MRLNNPLSLFLSVCFALCACQASAQSYEEELAVNLSGRMNQEEVVWLTSEGRRFLALYKQDPSGSLGVILVHGMGGHPDWPEVISPLRNGLAGAGWSTLSIQMPLLPPGVQPAEYGRSVNNGKARIESAIQFLQRKRYRRAIIIGYGFGAGIVADYLADHPADHKSGLIKAFVGISMQTHQFLNPRLRLLPRLEKISLPVLDIYGSRDLVEVIKQADDRRLAGKKSGGRNYLQVTIDGADHYFTGLEDTLISRVRAWVEKIVEPGT